MSTRFQTFLATHGIADSVLCPYTPYQNGIVERKHRHIIKMGLTLLATTRMLLYYWVDAFNAIMFLINRLPIKIL